MFQSKINYFNRKKLLKDVKIDFLMFFVCLFSENLPITAINLNVSKLPEVLVSKCSFSCIVSTHYTGLENNALHSARECQVLNKCQSSLLFLSEELVPFTWDFRIACTLTLSQCLSHHRDWVMREALNGVSIYTVA